MAPILEDLLKETIQQAIRKGLVKSGTIIVDATHVEAAVCAKSVPQVLRELTKGPRKEIYRHEYDLSEKFPDKPGLEADVEEEIGYTQQLLENIWEGVEQSDNAKIKEMHRYCGQYEKNRYHNACLTGGFLFCFCLLCLFHHGFFCYKLKKDMLSFERHVFFQ